MELEHYDVAVIGAGTAGIVAALSAVKNGAKTILLESTPMVGGELQDVVPIDGVKSASGKWVLGGIGRQLFEMCAEYDGYLGDMFDWRMMWCLCYDPEAMKLVLIRELAKSGVKLLLNTFACETTVENGVIKEIATVGKGGRKRIAARVYIDCTGDGDIAVSAGAPFESGDGNGVYQPITMMYKVCNVEREKFMAFVRDNPAEFLLAAHPIIKQTPEECAQKLYEQKYICAGFSGKNRVVQRAIAAGEVVPFATMFIFQTSEKKKEVNVNSTRVVNVDAVDGEAMGAALGSLGDQVAKSVAFMQKYLPGFEHACLSQVPARIGIRETRRIMGEYVLTGDDVKEARRFDDAICQGAHHIDIHTPINQEHVRAPIRDGDSYDIPYRCMIPLGLKNLLVAGRCISSTRTGNSSSRVIGTCMGLGEAAGAAAAICSAGSLDDVRLAPIETLRDTLRRQGCVLD